VFAILELAEEKSLHSQKQQRWEQQIYVTNEKYLHSEYYKTFLYASQKSARNILPSLSSNINEFEMLLKMASFVGPFPYFFQHYIPAADTPH